MGQCELMYTYDRLFTAYSHTVAQILLTGVDVYKRQALTLSHLFGLIVSGQHGVDDSAPQALFFQRPDALDGAAAGAAHGVLEGTGVLACLLYTSPWLPATLPRIPLPFPARFLPLPAATSPVPMRAPRRRCV